MTCSLVFSSVGYGADDMEIERREDHQAVHDSMYLTETADGRQASIERQGQDINGYDAIKMHHSNYRGAVEESHSLQQQIRNIEFFVADNSDIVRWELANQQNYYETREHALFALSQRLSDCQAFISEYEAQRTPVLRAACDNMLAEIRELEKGEATESIRVRNEIDEIMDSLDEREDMLLDSIENRRINIKTQTQMDEQWAYLNVREAKLRALYSAIINNNWQSVEPESSRFYSRLIGMDEAVTESINDYTAKLSDIEAALLTSEDEGTRQELNQQRMVYTILSKIASLQSVYGEFRWTLPYPM